MKRLLLSAAAVLFAFSANAQISSDTLTYTRGTLGVQAVFPVNINSQSSCADTMGISIPSGHWISSIELKYEVQTQGGGFGGVAPNDVGTYVEFVSESTKETGLTYTDRGLDDHGWFFMETGGWTYRKAPKKDVTSDGRDEEIPAYLHPKALKPLLELPSAIKVNKARRTGSSLTLEYEVRGLGGNPKLRAFLGNSEGLTLAEKWAHREI